MMYMRREYWSESARETRILGRWRFRLARKTLGKFQPGYRVRAGKLQICILNVAHLRYDLREVHSLALHILGFAWRIPRPNRP